MTRQCAWCDCYLDSVESETIITHGICERCAERIRRSWPESVAPLLEDVFVGELHNTAITPALCEIEDRAA